MLLYLSSQDSSTYYPNNNSADFRSYLSEPLQLTGQYVVSLIELYMPGLEVNEFPVLFVYCSLCEELLVGGVKKPVLRMCDILDDNEIQRFPQLVHIPIREQTVNEIRVYINWPDGSTPSFKDNAATYCTLEITKLN